MGYCQPFVCCFQSCNCTNRHRRTGGCPPPTAGKALSLEKENTNIEEIVVTATRREERLQSVPVSVSAVSAKQLEAAGITNPQDLTRVVPNLTIPRTTNRFTPVIRGISSSSVFAGDESNVAVYVDGVYIADQTAGFYDLLETERIEVLRGPQGTLFGRNATGGLINIITKDPSFNPSGNVTARYGSFDTYSVRGYVTTGLTDTLAADVAGYYSESDGYIKDLLRGGKENPSRAYSIRSKLLFKPTSNFRVRASLTREYRDDPTGNGVFVVDRNTVGRAANPNTLIASGPRNSALNSEILSVVRATRGDVQMQLQLPKFNIETTTSYAVSSSLLQSDTDGSVEAIQETEVRQRTKTLTNELRIVSNSSGNLDWIAGVFVFNNNATSPITIRAGSTQSVALRLGPHVQTDSIAGFGELTYHFSQAFKLTAGLRYTYEKREFSQSVNGNEIFDTDTSFKKWTPRVALFYELDPRANFYASFSQGFKSGGYNASGTSPIPVKPEVLNAYEIGLKTDPAPWLRINGAIFYYDYKDLQVSARDPSTELFLLQNAATARVKGGEIEFTARATPEITFNGGVAYTDGKYRKFPFSQNFNPTLNAAGIPVGGNTSVAVDVSGNQMTRAPKFTLSLGGEYAAHTSIGRIGGSTNIFYSSKVYWDTQNSFVQPAYTLLSGEIFWEPSEAVRLSFWGRNLTDKAVAAQVNFSTSLTTQVNIPPREVGVSARFGF